MMTSIEWVPFGFAVISIAMLLLTFRFPDLDRYVMFAEGLTATAYFVVFIFTLWVLYGLFALIWGYWAWRSWKRQKIEM